MFTRGEKPGLGVFTCRECGFELVINRDSEALPGCPRCGGGEFLLYGRKK